MTARLPDDAVLALPGGALVLSGWYVRAVASMSERQANVMRRDGVHTGSVFDLLAAAVAASAEQSCAAQPAQPAKRPDLGGLLQDEIDVKEAARLMHTTTQNVRKRCKAGTLERMKVGGRWVLSRRDVLARLERKAA